MSVLTTYRKAAELTQTQLAEKTGLKQAHISRWETGERELKKASGETLLKLANALGVKIEDLLQ